MGNSTFFALLFTCFVWCSGAYAQKPSPATRVADRLTQDMGASLNLPEGTLIKVKTFNRERMTKLMALSQQANQLNSRELELRVDQIEQEYHQRMFNTLNSQQYIQYKRFRVNRNEFIRPNQALASAMNR